ncbi:MAG: LPP20 family lipoprotein [Bacteroidaceae bacterium]|nr:LPP20 family lipoprotein [Bacteroidaceae bacterium]
MKKTVLYIIALMALLPLNAQQWEDIKNNPKYLTGEGIGISPEEADKQALANLMSKISMHVQSDFEVIEEEKTGNDGTDSRTYVSNRVKTYSQGTLQNTERIDWENGSEFCVGRFIQRSEVERIFKARLLKAQEKVTLALQAEAAGQVDDALRNFTQAIALTRSLQRPNEAYYETPDKQKHQMMAWLPQKKREVMKDVKISAAGSSGNDIELNVTFRGKPVTSMNFTYYDGRMWCPRVSAKDGKALVEMAPGFTGKTFRVRIEHQYLTEDLYDNELSAVMKVLKPTRFDEENLTVKTDAMAAVSTALVSPATQGKGTIKRPEIEQAGLTPVANEEAYVKTIEKVLEAIRSRNYKAAEQCFTLKGRDMYDKLITYGSAKLLSNPSPVFHRNGNDVICRGIKMSFNFRQGVRKSFVEEMVFTMDKQAKISSLAFGLGNTAEQDILYKGAWPEQVRTILMQFMENYKTAFALKRLDYINTIFDKNAVIITGNEVQVSNIPSWQVDRNSKRISQKKIQYMRYDKERYLSKLAKNFKEKEFINIHFTNNDVKKLGSEDIYAIQIAQDYYSDNYADKGYLMLIIDITKPERPLIKVRTWQPDKDPDFGFYGPGDFS